jgi:uncharacterized protein (TIGR03435 family)
MAFMSTLAAPSAFILVSIGVARHKSLDTPGARMLLLKREYSLLGSIRSKKHDTQTIHRDCLATKPGALRSAGAARTCLRGSRHQSCAAADCRDGRRRKIPHGVKVDQAQVDIGYSSLADLIRIAYEVKPYQISGPDWMADQKWDIQATIPDGAQPSRVPQMLQVLPAERFGLTVHRENQGRRVYGLEVAKGGPKLKATLSGEAPIEGKPLAVAISGDGNATVSSGAGFGITRTAMQPDGSMHFESSKMTPAQLADALSFYLDRPVIDLTHLQGSYLVALEFSGAVFAMQLSKPELRRIPNLPPMHPGRQISRPTQWARRSLHRSRSWDSAWNRNRRRSR